MVVAAGNLITKCAVLLVAPTDWESQGYEIIGFIKQNDTHHYIVSYYIIYHIIYLLYYFVFLLKPLA